MDCVSRVCCGTCRAVLWHSVISSTISTLETTASKSSQRSYIAAASVIFIFVATVFRSSRQRDLAAGVCMSEGCDLEALLGLLLTSLCGLSAYEEEAVSRDRDWDVASEWWWIDSARVSPFWM